MNQTELNAELIALFARAAKDIDAAAMLESLTSMLASILAFTTIQIGASPDAVIETIRHDLDNDFVGYLKAYRETLSKTA